MTTLLGRAVHEYEPAEDDSRCQVLVDLPEGQGRCLLPGGHRVHLSDGRRASGICPAYADGAHRIGPSLPVPSGTRYTGCVCQDAPAK